jgi:hypothetical protein
LRKIARNGTPTTASAMMAGVGSSRTHSGTAGSEDRRTDDMAVWSCRVQAGTGRGFVEETKRKKMEEVRIL